MNDGTILKQKTLKHKFEGFHKYLIDYYEYSRTSLNLLERLDELDDILITIFITFLFLICDTSRVRTDNLTLKRGELFHMSFGVFVILMGLEPTTFRLKAGSSTN